MNELRSYARVAKAARRTDIGRCIGAVFSGLVGGFVLGLFNPVFALPGGRGDCICLCAHPGTTAALARLTKDSGGDRSVR